MIVFFGPLFNLIFAVLLLTIIIWSKGDVAIKPEVSGLIENSPALNAGIEKGDIIYAVNGEKISDFAEVINIVAINNLNELEIEVVRDGKNIVKKVQPEMSDSYDMFGNKVKMPTIGIIATSVEVKKIGLFSAFIEANKSVYKMCKDTLVVLGQIITGNRGTDGLGGPLKIAQYSSQSFRAGFLTVLYFMALISANLGLMNLLPIPVLDGGHLLFFIIEMIAGRPIPETMQEKLLQTGFVILIAIMIFATFNDIRGFFR